MLDRLFSAPRCLLLVAAALLTGCDDAKGSLGLTRDAPDEFRVVSRPPLSVPPDFSLRPPLEAGSREATSATQNQAQSLVLGTKQPESGTGPTAVTPVEASMPVSRAESVLLQKAGKGDPNVRSSLRAETPAEDPSLLQRLRDDNPNTRIVDPEKEKERLKTNKDAGKPVTEGETPSTKSGGNFWDRLFN